MLVYTFRTLGNMWTNSLAMERVKSIKRFVYILAAADIWALGAEAEEESLFVNSGKYCKWIIKLRPCLAISFS